MALAEVHSFDRTILCPEALGRDAQLDANQTTAGKGSQTSLNQVSSCLEQQAAKPCKASVSLLLTCARAVDSKQRELDFQLVRLQGL